MKSIKILITVLLSITTIGCVNAEEKNTEGVPYVTLNNGQSMPRFGIGTFNVPGDSVADDAVSFALKNG